MVEGMVAGVQVTSDEIAGQLARRRLGYGRGARMKFEQDQVTMLAGVRHGLTLGGPIAIEIGNTEWPKWETVMAADPVDPAELDGQRPQRAADPAAARATPTTPACSSTASTTPARCWSAPAPARPRPASRPAPSPAPSCGRRSASRCSRTSSPSARRSRTTARRRRPPISPRSTPARCARSTRTPRPAMIAEIEAAKKDGDTLGGVVEVVVARAAGRARLVHQRRQPPRQPAGRRGHGHPGDQGRRDRRRLRDRAPPRQRRPRRDVSRPRRRACARRTAPAASKAA